MKLLEKLRSIVGDTHARAATVADAVDGIVPSCVAEPGSAEEAAATLRLAVEAKLAVVPRGGGSKLGWGAPPSHADIVLSTARLDRILEHAAGDLVVRAQAGVRLETLQARLATAGQWLALDPPEPGGSLGGVVAAGASGPRRHRYGTPRDLLIGVTVALCDGSVAKAGGKVVKNVAGYDLCKLFTGSLGTLGVIVETTFRLHPKLAARRLVVVDLVSPRAVGDAVRDLAETPLVPSAVELCWNQAHSGRVLVLFEGAPETLVSPVGRAVDLLARHGRSRLVPDGALDKEWSAAAGTARNGESREPEPHVPPPASARVTLSGVPALVPEMISAVLTAARARSLRASLGGRVGLGILYASLAGEEDGVLREAIAELRGRLKNTASVVVRQASPGLKRTLDVWGDPGDAMPLMRRVKQRFDPEGTLSPGRFVGGL